MELKALNPQLSLSVLQTPYLVSYLERNGEDTGPATDNIRRH